MSCISLEKAFFVLNKTLEIKPNSLSGDTLRSLRRVEHAFFFVADDNAQAHRLN